MTAPGVTTHGFGHRPALDGVRGLALAAVLLYHSDRSWLPGGFFSLTMFFTLSGFLITALLVSERERTGRVALGAFWMRRARRLLPAALLALFGIALYGWLVADPSQLQRLRGDIFSALAYVFNWRLVFAEQGYSAAFESASPVQHFWSLAVEEQFYLVLPLVVVGVLAWRKGSRAALVATLGGLVLLSVLLSAHLAGISDPTSRVYYGSDTRAAEFLVGALLAVVFVGRPIADRPSRLMGWAGVAALAGLVVVGFQAALDDAWVYRGGFALVAVLAGLLVLASWSGSEPVASLMRPWPLRYLGTISYGVYLYHWPIFLFLSAERTGLSAAPLLVVRMTATLAVALVSYYLVELPIRERRSWVSARPLPAFAGATAVVVLATAVVTADPPEPDLDLLTFNGAPPAPTVPVQRAPKGADRPVETTVGESPPPLAERLQPVKVMVVGDSLGWSLGIGLSGWADRTGQAAVWNVAQIGCGVAEGGTIDTHVNPCEEGIDTWPAKVAEFDPDVVVMLTGPWELYDRSFGDGDPVQPGDTEFDRWLTDEFVRAVDVLSSQGADVVWLTSPCIAETDRAGTFAGAEVFEPERTRVLNEEIIAEVATRRPDVVAVRDLFAQLCPPGGYSARVGPVADGRPDGIHFADEAKPWLADWIMPKLLTDPIAP